MTFHQAGRSPAFEKQFEITKLDREAGIVYGFAIVSKVNGLDYWDLQNDHIPEDVMAKAADEFSKIRVGSDQHTGEHVGDIVFSMPILTGGQVSYKDAAGVTKTGLYIGYKPQDPVHFDMIASGERTGFSIGGVLLDSQESDMTKAVWSTALVDGFPDSSFLYIKPGGTKDASGKTTPRSNRMFPVKNGKGEVDLPHVRNALARIPQAKLSDSIKSDLAAKAKKLLGTEKSYAKAYGDDGKKKGRTFRAFKIHEISLVTRPAQEGAVVDVVKSVIASAPIEKDVALTSSDDGHQHVLSLDYIGEDDYSCLSWEYSDGADKNDGDTHSHKVLVEDGKLVVADNAGHGHTIVAPEGWVPYAPAPQESPATSEVEIISASADPISSPEVKPDLRSQKNAANIEPNKEPPMPKTPEEIAADVAKEQAAADLAKSNEELRKRLDDQAKATDEMRAAMAVLSKSLAEAESLRKDAELAKEAADMMSAMPGTLETHVATLKAISAIADEPTRKLAIESIKAANEASKSLQKATGYSMAGKPEVEVNAEAAFYKGAESFAKTNSLPMETDAQRAKISLKFQQTAEGSALYKAYADSKPASVSR